MFSAINLNRSQIKDSFVVLSSLLGHAGVRYSNQRVRSYLVEHAEFSSLLAIKDVLWCYGIESEVVNKRRYKYEDFETRFVYSIQQSNWRKPPFAVVRHADDNDVTNIDCVKSNEIDVAEFEAMDKDVILLLDFDQAFDEANYKRNRKDQLITNIFRRTPLILFILPILLSSFLLALNGNSLFSSNNWISFTSLLCFAIGLLTSVLLLWHNIDAYNPFLKEVCSGQGKVVNCGAVLNSKGSDFLGISWSEWGFAYFVVYFLIQLFYPGNLTQLTLWSVISLASSPYILYSTFYQWRVIKRWCTLCLTVQLVLLLSAIASFAYLTDDIVFVWDWYRIGITVLLGFVFLVLGHFSVPVLKQAKDSWDYENKWKKLRYNPDVFQGLLRKGEAVTDPINDIGVVIGKPDAKHEIIKVCNPYCGPCSTDQPELEQITHHNSDIRLRTIFTANGEDSDIKTPPVAHFLAIQQVHGAESVHMALDDWYLLEIKD